MSGVCHLVGAGEFGDEFTPEKEDLVIAADGGYGSLSDRGIRCDLAVGDMDSVPDGTLLPPEIPTERHPTHKDETDMYLAYLSGVRRGFREFVIHGGTGGRIDHTVANLQMLLRIRREGNRATLIGDGWSASVAENETVTLSGNAGDGVSVFAIAGEASGVTLRGLEYPLEEAALFPSVPLGVSNSMTGATATVTVRQGALLLIRRRGNSH